MSNQQPIIIEHHARGGSSGGPGGGPHNILRSRRWSIAAVLALIEILYVVFGRPSWLLATAVAIIVLVLAVMGIRRLRPGILRDALVIIAISQGLVVIIPIAITASVGLGLLLAVVVLIGVVVAAFRLHA
jgi:hypothetical protein